MFAVLNRNSMAAWLAFCMLNACSLQASSVPGEPGPVISGFGPVLPVEAGYNLDPKVLYRAVFDISNSPDDPGALNRSIESAARFLNMHARSGIDPVNMQLALVLHGSAGKDALNDAAYRERFGMNNPNSELLAALQAAGVQLWLCGQTAAYRGYGKQELSPAVGMALSAMTVLTRLQAEGWALLPW